jgi:hypothetical protein
MDMHLLGFVPLVLAVLVLCGVVYVRRKRRIAEDRRQAALPAALRGAEVHFIPPRDHSA